MVQVKEVGIIEKWFRVWSLGPEVLNFWLHNPGSIVY